MSLELSVIVRGLNHCLCCVFAITTLVACSSSHRSLGTASSMPRQTTCTLGIGERATFQEAGTLEVLGVRDDSRCPQDVTCVWAGDASVDVRLTPVRGNPAQRVLSLRAPSLELETPLGVRVTLVEIGPPARSGTRIPPADYRATFVLTRNRGDRAAHADSCARGVQRNSM